ncbi:MAG TPA: hypothetical protein VK507_04170 [Iamia sp.]|nr:hypothetical protein [Iamia sp.]
MPDDPTTDPPPVTGMGTWTAPPPPDMTDPVVVMRLAADQLPGTYDEDELVRALHACANALVSARRPRPTLYQRARYGLGDWVRGIADRVDGGVD